MADREDLAGRLAASTLHVHVVSCGGGIRALSDVWDVPGSSGVLGATSFCNDMPVTDEYLGFTPDKYVSREAALELAMAAFKRSATALHMTGNPENRAPVGLAITASVASNREHRGDHQAFVASVSQKGSYITRIVFEKGVGQAPRVRDAANAELHALHQLVRHADLNVGDLRPDSIVAIDSGPHHDVGILTMRAEVVRDEELRGLFMRHPLFTPDGRRSIPDELKDESPTVLMATLNPLHGGHEGQLAAAEDRYGGKSLFIVTTKPRHGKQPPTVVEMLDRAAQVRASNVRSKKQRYVLFSDTLVLNEDVTAAFRGCSITIGADACIRMLEPQWYPDGDVAAMLMRISKNLGHFLTFGREVDGRGWVPAKEVAENGNALLPSHVTLFHPMEGRWDISSSSIRKAHGGAA